MIRLHVVVEGQTEETFVNRVLANHLGQFNISVDARCVETSRRRAKIYRGGVREYARLRRDLILWMKEDQNNDAHFTTMCDFYALPKEFPFYDESRNIVSLYERVARLEQAFKDDLQHPRFTPYLQLHEFEALLLTDPAQFDWEFLDHERAIQNLIALTRAFESPELINDGTETAPSKRITSEIPEYAKRKTSAGPIIAEKIGMAAIREKCPHFASWLSQLEALVQE